MKGAAFNTRREARARGRDMRMVVGSRHRYVNDVGIFGGPMQVRGQRIGLASLSSASTLTRHKQISSV